MQPHQRFAVGRDASPAQTSSYTKFCSGLPITAVVAAVLIRNARICLLERSHEVAHDSGKWHCVTGYLSARSEPLDQALAEVWEETALDLGPYLIKRSEPFDIRTPERDWLIHAFLFWVPPHKYPLLNWENSSYTWLTIDQALKLDHVAWLPDVLNACLPETMPPIQKAPWQP